jgi:hypothetical protein
MSPKQLAFATFGPLLLATGLCVSAAEEVITQGIDVDVRQFIDEAPQGQSGPDIGQDVQDLGDGTTNDGGEPDALFDPRDAALEDEKNLGPNAPGYIP